MLNIFKSLCLFSFVSISYGASLHAETFLDKIAAENMKTVRPELDTETKAENESFTFSGYLEYSFDRENNPSTLEKRRLAFSLLKKFGNQADTQTDIIDFTSLQDLHLLNGPSSDPTNYLADHIDRTHTEVGKVALLYLLATPVSQVETLRNRQEIVKAFLQKTPALQPTYFPNENSMAPLPKKETEQAQPVSKADLTLLPERIDNLTDLPGEETRQPISPEDVALTFDSLEDRLRHLSGLENHVLALLDGSTAAASTIKHRAKMRQESWLPFEKLTNTLPSLTGAVERFNEAQELLSRGRHLVGSLAIPLYILAVLIKQNERLPNSLKNLAQSLISMGNFATLQGLIAWILNYCNVPERANTIINGIVITADNNALQWEYLFNSWLGDLLAFKHVQIRLIALVEYINTMKMAMKLLESSSIHEKIPAFKKLHHVLIDLPQEDPEFDSLLKLLQANTFKGDASYLSNVGNIIIALRLVEKHKEKLMEGIIALGEIDAYVSIASLFKERMVSQTRWCFAEYKEHESTPILDAKNFWNPFIDPAVVVTNTVQLGTPGNARSIIITGPNAGGKSTAMTALVYAALLSQTLGIAPAQEFVFTPFSKILTYLKITDDIAAGNSHFKAGAARAQEVATAIQSLSHNQWSMTAVDEVFNGTTHREGEAAAYSFIEMLGSFDHNLCLTTTHFPLITNLEKETDGRLFKNYKVSVGYDNQGKLLYPFKLQPGISDQNIAFDVLKEEGFTASFLEKARIILAQRRNIG